MINELLQNLKSIAMVRVYYAHQIYISWKIMIA